MWIFGQKIREVAIGKYEESDTVYVRHAIKRSFEIEKNDLEAVH